MAELIVVTGPPGAGKTTVAQALSRRYEPSALVAGDDFFAFIDRGYISPWTAEAQQQNETVTQAAAGAAGRLAAGEYTVTYDGVVGPWMLSTFAAATGLSRLHYVMLLPSEHTCLARVRSRVGHGFTDVEAARHMYAQFAEADIDHRHVLTSTEPATVMASSIRDRVTAGSLLRTVSELQ